MLPLPRIEHRVEVVVWWLTRGKSGGPPQLLRNYLIDRLISHFCLRAHFRYFRQLELFLFECFR